MLSFSTVSKGRCILILADAKASVTSRRNFNFLEGAVYILLSQDYIGDNRFAKILYNFSGKAGEKTKLR